MFVRLAKFLTPFFYLQQILKQLGVAVCMTAPPLPDGVLTDSLMFVRLLAAKFLTPFFYLYLQQI
jgi:hypothetical protein